MSNETHDSKSQQTEQPTEAKKNESTGKKECHGCVDCAHTNANHKPCQRLKWKYSMKRWVFALILCVCLSGIIVPFLAQYLAPPKSVFEVALDVWNQYVSIILGVVATLLSIVSLVFSFHNEEEENIQQRNYDKKFGDLVKSITELKGDLEKSITELKGAVDNIYKTTGEMNVSLKTISDRLTIIESSQNNKTTKNKTAATSKDDGEEYENDTVE